jgi:glycosyltransferase involved in cell wall biosynthesis
MSKYSNPGLHETRNHFLFVGNKETIDGYDLLKDALALTSTHPKIRFVGCDGVTFDANDEGMAALYRQSVATLCLARLEPFGLAPIESMACGTPVIAVNEGGYKDTVVDGECGYLIERNPDLLIRSMLRLSNYPAEYGAMCQAARKRAKRHFSWSIHVERLERVLEGMSHD